MNSQTILLIIFLVVISAFILFLLIETFRVKRRMAALFDGKKADDIEKILNTYVKGVKKYFDDIEEIKKFSQKLYTMSSMSIQKIGIIRFNPFGDVGGDQSFSIALLNFENTGIVITSLYSREGTRVYSKPVSQGSSANHLAEEEKEAINKAIKDYQKEIS